MGRVNRDVMMQVHPNFQSAKVALVELCEFHLQLAVFFIFYFTHQCARTYPINIPFCKLNKFSANLLPPVSGGAHNLSWQSFLFELLELQPLKSYLHLLNEGWHYLQISLITVVYRVYV